MMRAPMSEEEIRRAERTLAAGTWTITAGALLYSVLTVTPLVAKVTPAGWGWTAPILPLVVDAAVVIVVRLDSTVARLGGTAGKWPVLLRWLTGCMTLALNIGDSALKGDRVGVAVHAVAPLLLIVTAEAGLSYRRAITTALARIAREQQAAADRERAERERRERSAREERERARAERERAEREEREHAERLAREQAAREDRRAREEREHAAAMERERLDREREERERDREEARAERARQEAREERERQEARERAERERVARELRERAEAERREREERERLAREQRAREARERAERERVAAAEREAAEARVKAAAAIREQAEQQPVNTPAAAAGERVHRVPVSAARVPAVAAVNATVNGLPAAVNTRKAGPVNTGDKLPEAEALAVVRELVNTRSVRQIADATGWSVGWVSARIKEIRGAASAEENEEGRS